MRRALLTVLTSPFLASTILLAAAGCALHTAHQNAPVATTSAAAPAVAAAGQPARLYKGYNSFHRAVTTTSPQAQQWFDQGMQLLYGFNHDEAIRSFRQAATVDPDCAMAWWGVAYGNGLHINNMTMTAEQSQAGYNAAQEALKRISRASPAEQSLIRAVAKRYAWPAPENRRPLDEAYAAAMGEAWQAYPDDPDIGALYAESLMDLQAWDYWTHDGQPKGRIDEICSVLESVTRRHPEHPGANHFYIHAVEASSDPAKATPAADRLGGLVPGSGHLVHMPSHIYIRTGRYADAADTNERAIRADDAYFALAPPPRFYRIYFIHNLHFLAYASMMEGRREVAMAAVRRIDTDVPDVFLREFTVQADGLMAAKLHVMIRFGMWNEILAEPSPPDYRLLSRAFRHYARCIALSAQGRTDEAHSELEQFDDVIAGVTGEWYVGNNPAQTVLPIARRMMAGELAYREGRSDAAYLLLREAVTMEEGLNYDEPPGWMQPVRHALVALLMADGRAAEAEEVYRADLERHPRNGWSLLGLEQSLRAQGRDTEAAGVHAKLVVAWARADVKPTSSCYCAPVAGAAAGR